MAPAKPLRTKHLVKSSTTGSFHLPSPSAEPAYQDPDIATLLRYRVMEGGIVGRSQSVAVKPKPLPRSKSQPEALCCTTSMVHPVHNSSNAIDAVTSKHNAYPADYKTPRPVRRPPSPPKNKRVTSSRNGSHDNFNSNTEQTVKSMDFNGERIPAPVPPPRPERPRPPSIYYASSEYERTLPDMGLKPQGSTEGSLPSSLRPIPEPPVLSKMQTLNLNESYDGRTPGVMATDNGRPAGLPCLPRPGQSLTHTPSHSPLGYETLSLQVREPLTQGDDEHSPGYEDRRAPSIPPKTRNYQRLSISSASSSTLRPHYDTQDDVLSKEPFSAKENSAPARPQLPPPPWFSPPPPPSIKRSSLSHPLMTDSLYAEIEDCFYLEVLPEENNDRMFRPSESVYNSGYKHYKTPRRPTLVHPLPHAGPLYQSGYLPPLQPAIDDTNDIDNLLGWLRYSDGMAPSLYGLSIENETREFNQRAMCVKKALRLFNLLLIKRNDILRGHISELTAISDSLDKAQRKAKTMGIAGGTTGAVGGVAAVVGIALAPVTMGASLVATAIGAGMVASAGGMGAHAAIVNKKSVDRKRVEKIVQDYKASIFDLEHCLVFIHSGMDELRRHDLARLQRAGAQPDALRMAELSQSVFRDDMYNVLGKSVAPAGGMSSERLLQAFAKEMDLYFTEKDGQRMKKSTESRFSSRVCLLAQSLQEALDKLNHMGEMFSRF